MDLTDFVKVPIVIGIIVVLQIVKHLLDKRRIRFKNQDNWLWIILLLGIPMAVIGQGIDGWGAFNAYQFIINCFLYAAAASILYKTYKVGGKNITGILKGMAKDE